MLRQSLKTLGIDPLPLLAIAGIEPTSRAEEISVEGFVALARAFERTLLDSKSNIVETCQQ
jgi:16S rRNA (adenine1518-N6/adenine1519-N6)-dimethyltransferase